MLFQNIFLPFKFIVCAIFLQKLQINLVLTTKMVLTISQMSIISTKKFWSNKNKTRKNPKHWPSIWQRDRNVFEIVPGGGGGLMEENTERGKKKIFFLKSNV